MVARMGGAAPQEKSPTDSRPTVRDEMRELTHQRLLAAAQVTFERDGYARTTINGITQAAGVNRATFYLHFADKAEALFEVLTLNLVDAPDYWQRVGDSLVTGDRAAVRAALGRVLEWYQTHKRLLLPVREAMAAESQLAERSDGTFSRLAGDMTSYLAEVPAAQRGSARLRLELLLIQFDQLAFRLVVQELRSIDEARLLDELTDIWMSVLPTVGLPRRP